MKAEKQRTLYFSLLAKSLERKILTCRESDWVKRSYVSIRQREGYSNSEAREEMLEEESLFLMQLKKMWEMKAEINLRSDTKYSLKYAIMLYGLKAYLRNIEIFKQWRPLLKYLTSAWPVENDLKLSSMTTLSAWPAADSVRVVFHSIQWSLMKAREMVTEEAEIVGDLHSVFRHYWWRSQWYRYFCVSAVEELLWLNLNSHYLKRKAGLSAEIYSLFTG